MDWEERAEGKVMVLKFDADRLDAQTERGLKRAIADVTSRSHRRLVVDMSRVRFMDSTGLAALVSGLKQVGSKGDLVLCAIHPQVRKLLGLSRLEQVFRIFGNIDEAVAAAWPQEE